MHSSVHITPGCGRVDELHQRFVETSAEIMDDG